RSPLAHCLVFQVVPLMQDKPIEIVARIVDVREESREQLPTSELPLGESAQGLVLEDRQLTLESQQLLDVELGLHLQGERLLLDRGHFDQVRLEAQVALAAISLPQPLPEEEGGADHRARQAADLLEYIDHVPGQHRLPGVEE